MQFNFFLPRRMIMSDMLSSHTRRAVLAFLSVEGEPLLPIVINGTRNLTPLWIWFVGAPIALNFMRN